MASSSLPEKVAREGWAAMRAEVERLQAENAELRRRVRAFEYYCGPVAVAIVTGGPLGPTDG